MTTPSRSSSTRSGSLPGYLPDLALVAEDDGAVIGYVMFTHADLAEGGRVLMLSPLGVRPDRQRSGIGSALVEEGAETRAASAANPS